MKTILVIGGGITGLSAMYELQKWKKENSSDVKLILAEGSPEFGGKIRTTNRQGFLMEEGADSLVARKVKMLTSLEELGLENEVVYNATGRSYIYVDGDLKQIPADSVFGIPASVESLANTPFISAEGKVEALKDLYIKNESFTKDDSIGEFLEYFLGKELVEKQIAPILSGVYSGKLSDLTIGSTLPFLLNYKEEFGSIIKGLEANKKKFQSGGAKFYSLKKGLGALIDRFAAKLEDVEVYKKFKASKIEKIGDRYQVTFDNNEVVEADYVVLSIPHDAAEDLFSDSTIKERFASFENSSLISVYVGFDVPDEILPKDGTGFIAADTETLSCNACTWTSRKWEHTSQSGNLLVRMFYKSIHPSFSEIAEKNEEELLQVALSDIRKSLGIEAEPIVSIVTNWSDKMPNYLITHPQSVKALEEELEENFPGVIIAGCSYYGVGIPDCIENGELQARKITQQL